MLASLKCDSCIAKCMSHGFVLFQRWCFKRDVDRPHYFNVVSESPGYFLDIHQGSLEVSASLSTWSLHGRGNQEFKPILASTLTPNPTVSPTVSPAPTTLAPSNPPTFSAAPSDSPSGKPTSMLGCVTPFEDEDQAYQLKNRKSKKYLHAFADGSEVVQLPSSNSVYDRWLLQPVGNGLYYIVGEQTGFAIRAPEGQSFVTVDDGTLLDASNMWCFVNDSREGYYNIQSFSSGYWMDVYHGSKQDYAKISMYIFRSSGAQDIEVKAVGPMTSAPSAQPTSSAAPTYSSMAPSASSAPSASMAPSVYIDPAFGIWGNVKDAPVIPVAAAQLFDGRILLWS